MNSSDKLVGKIRSRHPENALFVLLEGSDVFDRYFPKKNKYANKAVKVIVTREGEEARMRERYAALVSGAEKILLLRPDSD